jgi:spore coat polysaccharide biosynthesis protein SpsF
MLPIQGRPMLQVLLHRLLSMQPSIPVIVATTTLPQDDCIASLATSLGVEVFRGSQDDVLQRFVLAVASVKSDCIVRVTADCPLCDPYMIHQALDLYSHLDVDDLSNTIHRTYPRGYDIEIISRSALMTASASDTSVAEKEHVTLFVVSRPYQFSLANFITTENWSNWRLTVDTKEDFALVQKLFEVVGTDAKSSTWECVRKVLHDHPQWRFINASVVQKTP